MFDFAKGTPQVYAHPIPGYPERHPRKVLKLIFLLLLVTGLAIGIGFLDFSGFESGGETTQPALAAQVPAPADNTPLIQPIPVTPSDQVELTPGLDIGNGEPPPAETQTTGITEPPPPVITPIAAEPAPVKKGGWQEHKITPGESLSTIFEDLGLSQGLLLRIANNAPKEYSLSKIRPGQLFRVKLDDQGAFEQLIWKKSTIESLTITPSGDGFNFKRNVKKLDKRQSQSNGIIRDSLFIDGQKAGLSDNLIMELAEVFQWDIDFALGIRKGDRFSLIYDEYHLDGKKYSNGDIIAAEFVNKGKRYRTIRYEHKDGRIGYYTPDGKSMRKAFIMTPVAFSRISSGFTPKRWHPVLKKWRSHRGVDYAAPKGTPVKAAGDGKIIFNGWKGGYGKVVMIEHERKHTTVYGHLSGFAKRNKVGRLVKQGQVIGYVGQTGLATGPHLHYEIRIAGKYTDPLKVTALPSSRAIPRKDFKRFKARANELFTQLAPPNSEKFALLDKKKKRD